MLCLCLPSWRNGAVVRNNLRIDRADAASAGHHRAHQLGQRGSQGEGQSFQFVPASRHDDLNMKMEQDAQLLLARTRALTGQRRQGTREEINWSSLSLHVTSMALPPRKRRPMNDLFQ
ncbi:hypothetical protein VPH35_092239 [Triticum aestivum]